MKHTPESITINSSTTVEDAKKQIAKAARIRDFNRIAIMEPSSQSIIKNRKALLQDEVKDSIMVKDLGPQISWKNVFIIEYIGPIMIHLAVFAARPYLYKNAGKASFAQVASLAMIVLHFLKREYETLAVHKFSNSTMPFFNVYKNSAHYWLLAGVNIAYWVYAPNASAAKDDGGLVTYVGLALYVFGELANLNAHIALSNLRPPGGTERGIPKGFGFNLVTCPVSSCTSSRAMTNLFRITCSKPLPGLVYSSLRAPLVRFCSS